MPRPFLEILPREIRDQVYTYVLTNASGTVGLTPWSVAVAHSLSILRTCKQIQREVKDIIWIHHGLRLGASAQISEQFTLLARHHARRPVHLDIDLEVIDRDELHWALQGLRIFADGKSAHTLRTITLRSVWERPRDVREYKDVLMLRKYGQSVDGRLYQMVKSPYNMHVSTGWPRFSHWGKQKWLKALLLDASGIEDILKAIHEIFGGELHVDGVLCFKRKMQLATCKLDPRDGEVRIVPETAISSQFNRRRKKQHQMHA